MCVRENPAVFAAGFFIWKFRISAKMYQIILGNKKKYYKYHCKEFFTEEITLKQALIELFGIDKLSKATQTKAINAYDKLLTETGNPYDSIQMRVFIAALGGHKLNEDVQTDLIEKSCMIVELERHDMPIPASMFKWDSTAETPRALNEQIRKDCYRWGKNESVRTAGGTDKIKVSDYQWEQNAYGTTQGAKS